MVDPLIRGGVAVDIEWFKFRIKDSESGEEQIFEFGSNYFPKDKDGYFVINTIAKSDSNVRFKGKFKVNIQVDGSDEEARVIGTGALYKGNSKWIDLNNINFVSAH